MKGLVQVLLMLGLLSIFELRPKIDYKETVSAKAELGGGVLLELSHEIDYLRWIFGEFNWVSAWHGKLSNLEIDVEDASLITSQNINQDDHEGHD